jgi:hypothetical protein
MVAGAAVMLMSPLAGFAKLMVLDGLVTASDPAATAGDSANSDGLFRLGVASLYGVVVLDVVLAWALLRVFNPVSKALSRLEA